jgi:hypothetical protein
MDPGALVEELIGDGQFYIQRLLDDGVPVRAAFWLKEAEGGLWYLYISTAIVDESGGREAYRRILDVFRQNERAWLADSDIKVIGTDNAIVREVSELASRFPGRSPLRSRQSMLGGVPAEEVYVYPVGQRASQQTALTEEQRQILTECYFARNVRSVDDLPYSDEMSQIHEEFMERTGLTMTVREVFKALKNLGRNGKLSSRSRIENISLMGAG